MSDNIVEVPEVVLGEYGNINVATELAFYTLIDYCKDYGILEKPLPGLMYLPDQAITRQFQEACRAVVKLLKK